MSKPTTSEIFARCVAAGIAAALGGPELDKRIRTPAKHYKPGDSSVEGKLKSSAVDEGRNDVRVPPAAARGAANSARAREDKSEPEPSAAKGASVRQNEPPAAARGAAKGAWARKDKPAPEPSAAKGAPVRQNEPMPTAVDKPVPPGFALGQEVILDGAKYTVIEHLHIDEHVLVMLAKINEKEVVVLKAQPAGARNFQVLNETHRLREIQNMGLELPIQSFLKYQCLDNQNKDGKRWYVLATTYEGETLHNFADENRKHSNVRNIFLSGFQVLNILERLHYEAQIVHRDIKQENLCIKIGDKIGDKIGEIRVIDLGTAENLLDRMGKPKTGNQAPEGTPQYMSPNVHKKKPLNPYDDIWSLLFMLLEMFMGKLPWHDAPERDMLRRKTAYVEQYFVRQDATQPPGMDENLYRCFCELFKHVHNPPMADRVRNYNSLKLIIEQAWTDAGLKPKISHAKFEY